jgi:hypothetical protein
VSHDQDIPTLRPTAEGMRTAVADGAGACLRLGKRRLKLRKN